MLRCISKCAVVLTAMAWSAFPQAQTTATLTGTVTDASGGVVAGALLEVKNEQTGAVRKAATDIRGEYSIALLPPGTYEMSAAKEGFAPQTRRGVSVTVGQSASIDFQLSVGEGRQIIEVSADAAAVETERAQQSNTIVQDAVRNLPINRRDYLTFTLLAPGVADTKAMADANSFRVKQNPDSGLSFYGSNGRGNNVTVDGGESNDAGGGVRPTVSQEAVQEFQINRTNYAAELGGARGGVINIVTKSGGNNLRGSVFGFFRHEAMDAGDPFAVSLDANNKLIRVKPDSARQQFGFTLGGPIKKDKTFYFLSYEQLRRRESRTVPVLTDASIFGPTKEQDAILSRLPDSAASQLRAALSSSPATIEMFRRNSGVFPFETDDYKGLLRLDHRFSEKNQLVFRSNTTKLYETNEGIGALVGYTRGFVQDYFDSNALAGWTHVFSPNTLNEMRVQYVFDNPVVGSNDPYGPSLEIAGFGLFNRDRFLPSDIIMRRFELVDNVTLIRGKHSLKLGGYLLARNTHADNKTFMSGRFTFGSLPGSLVNPALASVTINALQAFNLGLAQSYQQGFGDGVVGGNYPLVAAFLQDTWKPRRGLTINYGVRYELDARMSTIPTNKLNFAPRIGLAWDPFGDGKSTIRAGYGLFHSPIDFQIDYSVMALGEENNQRRIAQVLTVLSAANPTAANGPINVYRTLLAQKVIGVPLPLRPITADDLKQFGISVSRTGPRPPLSVIFSNADDYRNPYAQQGSFSIEREIVRGTALTASYVFVRGVKLTTSRDDNVLAAPVNPALGIRDWGVTADNPTGAKYFRDPLLFQSNVYESTANSFYHGLLIEGRHRVNRALTLNMNYTFSKAIDETVDFNSDFQPMDQLCRRCERALSSFDQRHKVVVYGVLQTQSAKRGTVFARVFADWLATPIFRYNSPRPFNLLAGTELNNDRHNTTDRPIFAGRNTGIGPSSRTFDVRLVRRIAFNEWRRLELMAEFFNLMNTLNFASVNNIVGNIKGPFNLSGIAERAPNQPLGFTQALEARRIQLGVRLSF